MSTSRTTPANVTTVAALNNNYVTGGVPPFSSTNPHGWHSCGNLLKRILTAPSCFRTTSNSGTPLARLHSEPTCFPTTSSSGSSMSRLQIASSCFPTIYSSGCPTDNVTTATALNYTQFTCGGQPFSSPNRHGWQSCLNLLVRILTAAGFFKLRLLQAPPRLGYKQ